MSLCGLKRGDMIWLLMVVYLGGDPVSVKNAEIGQTFSSEQACIKRMKEIFKEADDDKKPVPPEINMGCVAFKGKGA